VASDATTKEATSQSIQFTKWGHMRKQTKLMKLLLILVVLKSVSGTGSKIGLDRLVTALMEGEFGYITAQINGLPLHLRVHERVWPRKIMAEVFYQYMTSNFADMFRQFHNALPSKPRKEWLDKFSMWRLMYPVAFGDDSSTPSFSDDQSSTWPGVAYDSVKILMWTMHMDQQNDVAFKTVISGVHEYLMAVQKRSKHLDKSAKAFLLHLLKDIGQVKRILTHNSM
jgi:hypothetical protein